MGPNIQLELYNPNGLDEKTLTLILTIYIVLILVNLALSILFTVISVKTANRKGRNGTLWGILTFFFGLVPLIVVLCLPEDNTPCYWVCKNCGAHNEAGTTECSACKKRRY